MWRLCGQQQRKLSVLQVNWPLGIIPGSNSIIEMCRDAELTEKMFALAEVVHVLCFYTM